MEQDDEDDRLALEEEFRLAEKREAEQREEEEQQQAQEPANSSDDNVSWSFVGDGPIVCCHFHNSAWGISKSLIHETCTKMW